VSKVDWSKAPEGATVYAGGVFRDGLLFWKEKQQCWDSEELAYLAMGGSIRFSDYEPRPQEWPEESRIDAISLNGATGEHYQLDSAGGLIEAQDFLSEGLKILDERGKQYGSNERECSFPQVAQAFNAITGHNLKGSDICLILAKLKEVRQYAKPDRFHDDSAVDAVNYMALHAQELRKERGHESK
jgi:hypothetical protein